MPTNLQPTVTKGTKGSNQYLFRGNFNAGTAPTLLDSTEAQRVKRFLENLTFRTVSNITTGAPDANKFVLDLSQPNEMAFDIDLRTALQCDPYPTLGADLDLLHWGLKATRERQYFYQYGTEGLQVQPQNAPADTSSGYGGAVKMGYWSSGSNYFAGFKAPALTSNVIFTMPTAGDSGDNVIMTSDGNSLGFGTITAGSNVTVSRSGRDFTISATGGGGGGSGTVTSVGIDADAVVNGSAGAITSSGTITVKGGTTGLTTVIDASVDDLTINLTGTLDADNGGTGQSSYSTGDLLYASASDTISKLAIGSTDQVLKVSGGLPVWANSGGGEGGGTVTSVDVSGGSTGLTFSGGPITTSGTISMAGTLDADNGGTGLNSYTLWDILTASGTSALSRIGIGSVGQVLTVSSGGGPAWEDSSSGGTVTSVTVTGGTGLTSTGSPVTTSGTITIDLDDTAVTAGSYTNADITVDAQGRLTAASNGSGGGSGTVTSVATSNGTFIDVSGGTITTSGTITADLSATGTASSSTFLRGDNTWATPSGSGSGTVTSVDVSGGSTGLTFSGGPITDSGTITMAGTLDADNGGTGLSSYTLWDILVASGTSALSRVGIGSVGQVLTVSSGGGPAWENASGGSGTVTSVGTSNGTYINVTGGTITSTGTISADLSATGTADSTTFLRGDNTWAVPSGGGGGSGTVTNVASGNGLTGGPITTTGTLSIDINGATDGTGIGTVENDDELLIADYSDFYAVKKINVSQLPGGGGGGGVTSIDVSGGSTGLTFSGGPITTSGTITMGGGPLETGYGGTHNATYSTGDMLYYGGFQLNKLAIGSAYQILKVGPTSNPFWDDPNYGPNDAKYVTLGTDSDLTNERVLTAGTGISITDGGANGNVTISATGGGGGGSGTVTSITAGTGLNGGTITTSGTISLANTAVTAGSYTSANITVDAQGRITAASNGSGGGGSGMTSFDISDTASDFTVSNNDTVEFTSSDYSVYIDCSTSDTVDLTVFGDEFSDERLKDNVKPLGQCLDKVCELEPVSFDWNAKAKEIKKEGSTIGLIAQDAAKIVPDLVTEKKGYMAFEYQKLSMLLLQSIKELKTENNELKIRLEALENAQK